MHMQGELGSRNPILIVIELCWDKDSIEVGFM